MRGGGAVQNCESGGSGGMSCELVKLGANGWEVVGAVFGSVRT
jgi:hypothetical protein